MLYICIATFNCPKGILDLGGGEASKNKLKFFLEMKGTYILNILELLLFENLQRIY